MVPANSPPSRPQEIHLFMMVQRRSDGVSNESAAPPRTREPVDFLDEIVF